MQITITDPKHNTNNDIRTSKKKRLPHSKIVMEGIRQLTRMRTSKRGRRAKPMTLLILLFAIVFVLFLLQWLYSIPPPKFPANPPSICKDANEGFVLKDTEICTDSCGKLCFPRVHGICFGHTQVTICDTQREGYPRVMRFDAGKPRQKVPVKVGTCPPKIKKHGAVWIEGLQMVADLTLMPHGKAGPNPHHESEKIVPAILISQLYQNSTLYWFANPHDASSISAWSKGLLNVFQSHLRLRYLPTPPTDEFPICFEDAILFAGLTNSGYIPNVAAHDFLRDTVLGHCNIPAVNARVPLSNVVVLHRPNSSRNIANFEEMKGVLQKELQVSVRVVQPGPKEFCEQVRMVAEADLVVTPHGSHNVAALFMRPGAVMVEIFPLLYYIDWLGNLLHAGRMHHYELYGTWSNERLGMPLLMRVYSLVFGWERCFSTRQCMNYGKMQKIYVDIDQLEMLLHKLISNCRLPLRGSRCPNQSVSSATQRFHHANKTLFPGFLFSIRRFFFR